MQGKELAIDVVIVSGKLEKCATIIRPGTYWNTTGNHPPSQSASLSWGMCWGRSKRFPGQQYCSL